MAPVRRWASCCGATGIRSPLPARLARRPTKEVTILGEELVLYKDRSGTLGLIGRRCPHRRVSLVYGVPEDDGLRCQYHGWKFDQTGQCTEEPFEDTVNPQARFRDRISLPGYPVQELGGLVFAYLGPQPAPLLPRWAPLTWEEAVHDIAITVLPCNWLQCQENSLDPVHTEWLHGHYGDWVREFLHVDNSGRHGGRCAHQKIRFRPFKYGIIKNRLVEGADETHDDWVIGHPILFPNILLVGSPERATLQFRVPIDDEHTFHVSLYSWQAAPGQTAPAQKQSSLPIRATSPTRTATSPNRPSPSTRTTWPGRRRAISLSAIWKNSASPTRASSCSGRC